MSETPSRDQTPRDNAMSVAAISHGRVESGDNVWTRRLVLFLRIMAVVSVAKGLYHWAQVTGFVGGEDDAFENQSMAWQSATVYFAVIELVAAVGLWLRPASGAGGGRPRRPAINPLSVRRGLDPRIHFSRKSLTKRMDCRVKPGNDGVGHRNA